MLEISLWILLRRKNILFIMIKVFNMRELIKYMLKIGCIFFAIFFCIEFFKTNKNPSKKINKAMIFCIEQTIPEIQNSQKERNVDFENKVRYAFLDEVEVITSTKEKEEKNEVNAKENVKKEELVEVANKEENIEENNNLDKEAKVTEVQNSGVNPKSTNEYQGVKINNSTNYVLTEDILNPNITVNKNKVAIYHTHTCESYTPTEKYPYQASGNFRSIDLNYSVARVGDELSNYLKKYNVNVVHDKTYHDYPAYNGSYSRSLQTADKIVSANKDADIVIDLHRDAIGDASYAPKVKIGDEYVSQLMFVIGSDGANSSHKNWRENLKFAIKVQKKANELYPGLFKPIILRNSEYNQHVAKAACIIEVGATGNTLEESMGAMKYLARILNEI